MHSILICALLISFVVPPLTSAQKRTATGTLPPPQFIDTQRKQKLAAAFPEIERVFKTWMERPQAPPGAVFGVIIDGELALIKASGVREKTNNAPVTPETVFRIASMTKSFTAMAILKLRDEGKLTLEDPVSNYVPELANLPYPTNDSQVLNIRHLLTHSEGFPEDNPWGDRQLHQPTRQCVSGSARVFRFPLRLALHSNTQTMASRSWARSLRRRLVALTKTTFATTFSSRSE